MADGARLSAFISISISTHFVFQAEIKIIEAVPGRGSATPRAPALLCVSTELPAAEPRTTYSCGSLVHRCGWCFAHLEDEGFFAFCFSWNIALLFATFSGHVSSWNAWASPPPVSVHANPPGLLGRPVGTLGVNRGHLRTAWDKTRSELWRMPAASFQRVVVTHTPPSISRCRSRCCQVPRGEDPARKPRSAPVLAPAQARQPPVGRFRGPSCLPSIPKTWLRKANPRLWPALSGVSPHELGESPPALASSPLATVQLVLVTRLPAK